MENPVEKKEEAAKKAVPANKLKKSDESLADAEKPKPVRKPRNTTKSVQQKPVETDEDKQEEVNEEMNADAVNAEVSIASEEEVVKADKPAKKDKKMKDKEKSKKEKEKKKKKAKLKALKEKDKAKKQSLKRKRRLKS